MMAKIASFWIGDANDFTLSLSKEAIFAGRRKGVVLCEERKDYWQ